MMKKFGALLALVLAVSAALASCTGGGAAGDVTGTGAFTEGEEHPSAAATETETETGTDSPAPPADTAAPPVVDRPGSGEWVKLDEGIYDISAFVPEGMYIRSINYEKQLLLTYKIDDMRNGVQYVIPFDIDKMSADTEGALTFAETQRTDVFFTGDYVIYTDIGGYTGESETRVYSLETGEKVDTLTFSSTSSFIGRSKEPGTVLYVEGGDAGPQHVFKRDIAAGETRELFTWDYGDMLEMPELKKLVEGDGGYAFTGIIYPEPKKQSVACYGFIDKNGELVECNIREQFGSAYFRGGLVIFDEYPLPGLTDSNTGTYLIYDADMLKTREIRAEDKNEAAGRSIRVSENGRFILSGGPASGAFKEPQRFRVYDTESGEIIARFDPRELLGGIDDVYPGYTVSEAHRAVFVYGQHLNDDGTEIATEMLMYQF